MSAELKQKAYNKITFMRLYIQNKFNHTLTREQGPCGSGGGQPFDLEVFPIRV